MTTQTQTSAPVLPAALRMGAVELTVTDLDRSVHFYETAIGLRLHGREGDRAALGAGGEDLLVLVEDQDARRTGRHSGLYHFALLMPSRLELARAAARLAITRTRISGASDHGISEAIYLPDPDDNGIVLPAEAAAELRERVIAAGAPYEDTPDGLLVRDPWGIALLVASDA
jgi:catechol 2,3-dioxygenase